MFGRNTISIADYSVDDDINLIDDLFNIASSATLVLLGNDALIGDGIEGSGRVSARGLTTIDNGLTLSGSTLFVDMTSVTQSSSAVLLGRTVSDDLAGTTSYPDSVTARNIAGAIWSMDEDAAIYVQPGSEFVNLGLLEQTGGTSYISGKLLDRGPIQIDGSLVIYGPARFVDDQISGAGVFDVSGGVLVGTDVSTAAATDLAGTRIVGDVTISSSSFYAQGLFLGAGSVLDLTDPSASLNFYQSSITGAGEIDIRGDDAVGVWAGLNGDVTLDNFGDTTFTGSKIGGYGTNGVYLGASAWSDDTVTVENHSGATWTDQGTSSDFYGAGWGHDVFRNDGAFVEDTSDGAAFTMDVINDDVMQAGSNLLDNSTTVGQLAFDGELIGTGTVEVGPDKVYTGGAVGSGETFNFNSVSAGAPAPTLFIADLQDFQGTVSGFNQGGASNDQIEVSGTGWQFQGYVPYSNESGALDFANASTGAQAAIVLSGSYDPSGFHTPGSDSPTIVTYTPTNIQL